MADLSLLQPQNPVPASVLTDADFIGAAASLGCEVDAIKAVTGIEAPEGPFDSQGRPMILFERHVFSAQTGGIYDASHPDISNPVPGGYGPLSMQYVKLEAAAALNLDAALKSASWGMFQIMGMNFAAAGYASVEDMVTDYRLGDMEQLDSFVKFIQSELALVAAIQNKDWVSFAIHYNGRGEARNQYDQKIAAEYAKIVATQQ